MGCLDISIVIKRANGIGAYSYAYLRDDGEGWDLCYHSLYITRKYKTIEELQDAMTEDSHNRGEIISDREYNLESVITRLIYFLSPQTDYEDCTFEAFFNEGDFIKKINTFIFSP